jgi:hypothetical protein
MRQNSWLMERFFANPSASQPMAAFTSRDASHRERMMVPSTLRALRTAAITLALLTGCSPSGPELSTVSGTVTYDGKPIDQAAIMFQPSSGRPAMGRTDADGHYLLEYTRERGGTIPGQSQVFITTTLEDANGNTIRREFLPARYHRKSELTADVKPNEANVIDFHLTK